MASVRNAVCISLSTLTFHHLWHFLSYVPRMKGESLLPCQTALLSGESQVLPWRQWWWWKKYIRRVGGGGLIFAPIRSSCHLKSIVFPYGSLAWWFASFNDTWLRERGSFTIQVPIVQALTSKRHFIHKMLGGRGLSEAWHNVTRTCDHYQY